MPTGAAEALLTNLVDYAGLFPPAKLPLDEALRNYLRYQSEPESWMLGRFICPAARLSELFAFRAEILAAASPLVISALGRDGNDAAEFLEGVRADLADVAKFREQFGDKVNVEAYEVRLPAGLFNPPQTNQLHALVGTTGFLLETSGLPVVTPFFEPPAALSPWGEAKVSVEQAALALTLYLLAADRAEPEARKRRRCRRAGLKLRCGGLEAEAFPAPAQIALALTQARILGIPLKFTAGLHHALRHFDAGLDTKMHGFLNIFVAGTLAWHKNLTEDQVRSIVEEESAANFFFAEGELGWKDLRVNQQQIAVARRDGVTSFGSCSFDEPHDDLRNLKLLP